MPASPPSSPWPPSDRCTRVTRRTSNAPRSLRRACPPPSTCRRPPSAPRAARCSSTASVTSRLSPAAPPPIALPPAAVGTASSEVLVDRFGDVPVVTGGTAIARLDTGRDGHGGDETSAVAATHLSDRNEALHLSPDDVSHLDRDQIQRIRSASTRASWEDRRSTTNPMELTFI